MVTQVEKDRLKIETRYLIFFIALMHAIQVLNLVSNGLAPRDHGGYGFILVCIAMIAFNIHLYDESKCYRYCF